MLAVTIPIGIYAMALGMVVTGIFSTFINAYPNRLLLEYSFAEQWRDLMPAFILSLIMCGVTYSVLFLGLSVWATLILQIGVGVVVYTGLAWLVKLESLMYVINTVKEYYFPVRKGSF